MLVLLFQCRTLIFRFGEFKLKKADKFEAFSEDREGAIDEKYQYKEDLVNILILGIDGRGEKEKNTSYGFGPRADSIYLATFDLSEKNMTLLNISRDIVTDIKIFDSLGQEMGLYPMQLGMQYCYGDGLQESCELMEAAVSNLLNGIPIHGYCALYWNGITVLHDLFGPVTVDVPEYLYRLDPVNFQKSGITSLNAAQAKIYVQCRDINDTGSDELRRERQKIYFEGLYKAARSKVLQNPLCVFDAQKKVQPYLVTNLQAGEILSLTNWVSSWELSKLQIVEVPGKTTEGQLQDEYKIDELLFENLMKELFYKNGY